MMLELHRLNVPVSNALEEFARQRVTRALRPFERNVERIDLRLEDLNGPRGGVDKQCTITVSLSSMKRSLVIKSKSADAYDAVHQACMRIAESVARALTRSRQLARATRVPSRELLRTGS